MLFIIDTILRIEMEEFLMDFNTHNDYEQFYEGLKTMPLNVSLCDYEQHVHYNPEPIGPTHTTVEVEEDGEGNTITIVTSVTTHDDGSTSSIKVSTKRDENGTELGHETETVDTSGNINTQTVVKDEQGNDVVTSYVIDTSNNPEGTGEIIDPGDGIDTEFIPFDGTNGFVMRIAFYAKYADQPNPPIVQDPYDTSYHYHLLSAKRAVAPFYGLHIRFNSSSKSQINIGVMFSGDSSSTNLNYSVPSNGEFSYTFTYNPSITNTFVVYDNIAKKTLKTFTNKRFTDLSNMTITIGYAVMDDGTPFRYSNLTVREFSVSKL